MSEGQRIEIPNDIIIKEGSDLSVEFLNHMENKYGNYTTEFERLIYGVSACKIIMNAFADLIATSQSFIEIDKDNLIKQVFDGFNPQKVYYDRAKSLADRPGPFLSDRKSV